MKKKIAIVCSGWGMRCSYTWGFLVGLGTKFPNFKPDIMIATSGWAGSAMYYLTDQLSEMKNIWTDHLANRGFINPLRLWKIMNIEYAIHEVLRRKEPLHVEKLVGSNVQWYITARAIRNMKANYFSQEDIRGGWWYIRSHTSFHVSSSRLRKDKNYLRKTLYRWWSRSPFFKNSRESYRDGRDSYPRDRHLSKTKLRYRIFATRWNHDPPNKK